MRLSPFCSVCLRRGIVAVSMSALCSPFKVLASDIRIGGTGNALGTMRLLGEAFAKSHPEANPVILDSIGTSGAIEIGQSSRQLTDDESKNNLRTIEYARSPTVFAISVAEQRPGMTFAVIDQEADDKMESTEGSLGVATLTLILSERRRLRALTLNGVEPTPENAASWCYPIVKRFYFVLPKEPSSAVQEYIKFAKSPQGTEILKQTGHSIP